MRPLSSLTTIIFITLFIINVCSQPTVYEHSIKFENTTTAILVGEDGLIMKTTDNGNTWQEQSSGVVNTLYGNAIGNGTSISVGENGVILKTIDGGENWEIKASGTSLHLYDVEYMNNNNVVVCGEAGIMLLSTDIGETWSVVSSGTENTLKDIMNYKVQPVSFAVGSLMTILKSTNNGASWEQLQTQGLDYNLRSIAMISENEFLVVGEQGLILKTIDGGSNWIVPIVTLFNHDLNDVVFFNSNDGVIAADEGLILNTTDGGMTWSSTIAPALSTISIDFMSVAFSSLTDGISVGENGVEIYTTDGGATWSNRPPGIVLNGNPERNSDVLKNINNFPNPFNPSTTISFDITKSGNVKVTVYDMTGKEVSRLFEGYASSGTQKLVFNASGLSSGIYFYTITGDGFKPITQKMILIK